MSGALVAISAQLDIFGVVFVGCVTAFGGGIIRDIILGVNPPSLFENYLICMLSILVSIVVFVIAYINRKKFKIMKRNLEYINNFFDAFGLAAFTVTGAEIACIHGYADNGFIVVMMGIITGVGGGILRDIFTNTTPYIFQKHIYALASILGGLLYFMMKSYFTNTSAVSVASMLLIILIRLLATKYRWNLPKIHLSND